MMMMMMMNAIVFATIRRLSFCQVSFQREQRGRQPIQQEAFHDLIACREARHCWDAVGGRPRQRRLPGVPVIAGDEAPPAAGRIFIPHKMTAAAGEGRNHQTTAEVDGDGLGIGGRAPNTMAAAEGRHHHQTTVRMFGD